MPGTTDQSNTATMLEDAGIPRGDGIDAVEPGPPDPGREPDRIPLWKKVVASAAFVIAIGCLYAVFEILDEEPTPGSTGGVPLTQAETLEPPADTLGIHFDDVRDRWNSLEQPPSLTTQLRKLSETGPLDSFLHRFDATTELAGAYRDQDDYLVALMVRTDVDNPSASSIYLHLCHMIHPFSPDCIDSYQTLGLGGQTLEALASGGHEASWDLQGNEWRLSIAGGELTMRVLAPSAD